MARSRWISGAAPAALALLGLTVMRSASAQTFLITEVVPLSGHTQTVATGVNNLGVATGYSFLPALSGDNWASVFGFRWTSGTTTSIPSVSSRGANIATGINDNNEVVGYAFNISGSSITGLRPYLNLPSAHYSLGAGGTDIGDLGGGDGSAYGINNAGYVVGESTAVNGFSHAFVWLPTGFAGPLGSFNTPGMKDLGTLGGANSSAYAINGTNQIVGTATSIAGDLKAFLWSPVTASPFTQGLNDLGAMAVGADSIAYAVNGAGKSVGMSYLESSDTTDRGGIFTGSSVTQLLPLPGAKYSGANGINSSNLIVGFSSPASPVDQNSTAVIFSNGKRYNLNSLIGSAGWQLLEGMGISDAGYIVGYGYHAQPDLTTPVRGFVITPNFALTPITGIPASSIAPSSITTGAVHINTPVGIDLVVALSSNNVGVSVPASVVITAGTTSKSFTSTIFGAATGSATITASLNGVNKTATTVISGVAHISTLAVTPSPVIGGNNVTATATLSSAAVGNVIIPLTKTGFANGGLNASLPSITVLSGDTTGAVVIPTLQVSANSTGTIVGTLNGTASGSLTIQSPAISSLAVSPNPVLGGSSITVTATLNSPSIGTSTVPLTKTGFANGGLPVSLGSISITAGNVTGTTSITTNPVAANSTGTLVGTFNGSASTGLTITPNSISSITSAPTNPIGGDDVNVTINLASPASAGGVTINLTYTDPGHALTGTQPATLVIPAGATNNSFTLHTVMVSVLKSVTLSAKIGISAALTRVIKIYPIGVDNLTITPNPASLGSGTTTAVVTLQKPAPAGGWVVRLVSNTLSKAGFGPTGALATLNITIPAGQTVSVGIPIKLKAAGDVIISAQAPPPASTGGLSKSVTLTITP